MILLVLRGVALAALSVPVGATMLLLFMRLVPGRWEVLRPAAATLARFAPVVAAVVAVVVLSEVPEHAAGGFRGGWLATPWYVVRALLTLAVFAGLGWVAARGPVSAAFATVGLILITLLGSFAGIDWIAATWEHFHSAQFGLQFVAHLWLGGVAAALLLTLRGPEARPDGVAVGVLVASLMLWAYFWAMAYIVAWSGGLPEEARWWLARQDGAWGVVLAITAFAQFVVPFAVLLLPAARASRAAVAAVCIATLACRVAELLWLLLPSSPA